MVYFKLLVIPMLFFSLFVHTQARASSNSTLRSTPKLLPKLRLLPASRSTSGSKSTSGSRSRSGSASKPGSRSGSKPGSRSAPRSGSRSGSSPKSKTFQLSALTLQLCPETPKLEHIIMIEVIGEKNSNGHGASVGVGYRGGNSPYKVQVGDIYPQKTINQIKIHTSHEDQVVCVQTLVVDVTIMIDQPTEFKHTCPETPDVDDLPCRQFGDAILTPFVCPQKLTDLLESKDQIQSVPTDMPTDFKPPVYDITNDMLQASAAIADGVTESFDKVVKNRIAARKVSIKRKPISKISSVVDGVSSFLDALGPIFSIFGGITSIATTFLTPNPFDELADYMDLQFKQVNGRLTDIQGDIADLERLIEAQGSILVMKDQIQAIRYATMNYGSMVDRLAAEPVCGKDNLFNLREVDVFLKQYVRDSVDNSLIDLYQVEFGGVTEAGSKLLNPYAKAYCHSNPGALEKFAQELSFYGFAGSLAHFAYMNLDCRKRGNDDCDESEKDIEIWVTRLYKFLKRAEVFKVAARNPVAGLLLEVKDELEKIIDREAEKAPTAVPIPGLKDKVYELIVSKVTNTHDWSNQCVLKVGGRDESTLIIEVAQINDQNFFSYNDHNNVPWHKRVITRRFHIDKKHTDRSYKSVGITCGHGEVDDCRAHVLQAPSTPPKDRILFLMYNPGAYQSHYQHPNIIGKPHQSVFIDRRNVYAYYDNDGDSGMDGNIYVGCWANCRYPYETQFALIDNSDDR